MSVRHLYSSYQPPDADTERRMRVAQETWKRQPWAEFAVTDEMLSRLWQERGRQWPYIRDLFSMGCAGLADSDIVIYTNSDIQVRGDCCLQVTAVLQEADACYAFRRDFHHRLDAPVPDEEYVRGNNYAGSDLCAFRAEWWRIYRDKMPDMIVGFEAYDPVFRTLVERTNPGVPVCVRDVIAHERHSGLNHWEHPKNRFTMGGQLHNLGLARGFLAMNGVDPRTCGIRL